MKRYRCDSSGGVGIGVPGIFFKYIKISCLFGALMMIPWEMRLAGGGGVDNWHYEMVPLKCYSNIAISVIKHLSDRVGKGRLIDWLI